ncbi:MAG: hypothetical protein D6815_04520 [Candidatus Dadabacteria bacterium]|nr:MAG: hypothetical protein D6815_04520 [Candidatus Dadabacteria bacterium]
MNPFAPLEPALAVLSDGPGILPATGQAQEYLQQFDVDEYYDRIRTEDDKKVSEILETPGGRLYVDVPPLPRAEQHVFRYFVDGSVKTFFLGTLVEHERNTPVLLGQLGAAAVTREDDGRVHVAPEHNRKKIVLLLNKSQVSEPVWNNARTALQNARSPIPMDLVDTNEDDPHNSSKSFGRNKEARSRAAHKANWEMRLLERDLLRDLLAEHDQTGAWIAVDGGLGKEFKEKAFDRGFVGVIKNFSKEQVFELTSRGRTVRLSLFQLLAKLQVNQRTAAFGRGEGHVVFWYVRIREQRHLEYPLMGVLKIEYPNPGRQMVDSDLIDWLSRALVAERSVTPHGKDRRWHAHLYPIYLAEEVIKNGFYSEEVLRAGIKWPGLNRRIGPASSSREV